MVQGSYWGYILASRIGGTLYIGITNDLVRRVYQHRSQQTRGFTRRYGVTRLVYFEQYDDPENAIRREKRLKKWTRP
jgi:putative endonuclease